MFPSLSAVLDNLASLQSSRWHAVQFRQGEGLVSFRADRAEVLHTAIDTLYGYRVSRSIWPGRAGWNITVRAAAVLDTAVVDEVFADAPRREIGPRLDARMLNSARGRTFWVTQHATIIHANHSTHTITAYCSDAESARYWAVRLPRQAMTMQLVATGAVYAHAAAFSHRGRGVLITGHKGAGKTTTLLTSLQLLGGDYVTNDRLLLRREDGDLVGRPWPMHIRVGVGTLLTMPELIDLVSPNLRELPEHRRWHHRDKVALEPPEFPRLLSQGVVLSEVCPRLMLWPYLSTIGSPATPAAVAADEVHDVLLATQLFMRNPASGVSAHVNHWLINAGPATQAVENLRQVVEDLAGTVPCFRIPVNGEPAALAARISELLSHIPPAST